jgi:hypothetical protein
VGGRAQVRIIKSQGIPKYDRRAEWLEIVKPYNVYRRNGFQCQNTQHYNIERLRKRIFRVI